MTQKKLQKNSKLNKLDTNNDNIISGQTELASGLADTDELLVSDAGTVKRMDLSVVKTYLEFIPYHMVEN